MVGSMSTLPKEVFIGIPGNFQGNTRQKPFLLGFLEKPTFSASPNIKATRVSSLNSTAGNDVLDYNYDD